MSFEDIFAPLDEEVFSYRGEARDNVIRNLLTADDFATLNQSQARQLFRDVGFSFRDSTFNEIYNEVVGISKLPTNIVRLGDNTVPSEGYLVDRNLPGSSRYSFTVRYDMYNPDTGGFDTKFSTIYSDDLVTIGELKDEFSELSEDTTIGSPPLGAQDARIVRGYIDRSKI